MLEKDMNLIKIIRNLKLMNIHLEKTMINSESKF